MRAQPPCAAFMAVIWVLPAVFQECAIQTLKPEPLWLQSVVEDSAIGLFCTSCVCSPLSHQQRQWVRDTFGNVDSFPHSRKEREERAGGARSTSCARCPCFSPYHTPSTYHSNPRIPVSCNLYRILNMRYLIGFVPNPLHHVPCSWLFLKFYESPQLVLPPPPPPNDSTPSRVGHLLFSTIYF